MGVCSDGGVAQARTTMNRHRRVVEHAVTVEPSGAAILRSVGYPHQLDAYGSASSVAHRRARSEDGDPSMPTTIRSGRPVVAFPRTTATAQGLCRTANKSDRGARRDRSVTSFDDQDRDTETTNNLL